MSFERYRKKLLAEPRHWGDLPPRLPYTPTRNCASNKDFHEHPLAPDPSPDPPPDPPAGPLESTRLRIPIPANTTMISTKGWSLNSLINQSINFHRVPRVSVLSDSLLQCINDYETSGVPLVIEGCHKHPKWSPNEFTLESFASASPKEITVRNVHDWQDATIPLSDFITKSRSIATFAEGGEQERFYGKDAPCPERWVEWLNKANVVPQSLLSGSVQDFFRYRPLTSPVETLMCYLGVGDTFTPCHKDLCASSGQNLMCHTENGGSSFWFMTESANALEVSKFFHSLGRELDHENYVITVEELSKAPFKVYILEQKLGDLVLVPPRSAHQVVNFGGITVKTSWSRMTLKGLVTAYHHELPIYRRVCRSETYRVKGTIRHVLLGLTADLHRLLEHDNGELVSNIQELLVVFDHILAEEESDTHGNDLSPDEANITQITCDFCGADIFQGFFECRTCVEVDSAEGGYTVCPGCYTEGRSCEHQIMRPMQRRPFKSLLDVRKGAIQVVDLYERRHGRTFQLSNDINNNYVRTFRAALVLLDIYKTKSSTKKCTLRQAVNSHTVPFSWALSCKKCHHANCFSHVLSEHRTHSVEALLLHDGDNTHEKYHSNHTAGRKARFRISLADPINNPLELPPLVYYAIHFTHCKPCKPRFMNLGWYDANAHVSEILDDQQSPAETESTLVPDTTVSVSAENGPVVVQPPTNNTPEVTGKRVMKTKAYVLVPPAPYPTPGQGSHSHRRSQANSSTSAPLVIRDVLRPTVNKPEQRVPPSQVDGKVPKEPTMASTPSLSDISISIPTTVREPGPFIIHTPHVITQSTEHLVEPVNPRTKAPHVGNPVTAQVITKGSMNTLRFKKSKTKPTPSSSNNTTTVASTDTQGGRKHPNQPQSQPTPPTPLPEVPNAFTELTAKSIADQVMDRFDMLISTSGQPMGSFDTIINSNGNAQNSYSYNSHTRQHSGPPPQYNGSSPHYDPQQHISSPHRYRLPHHFRHYRIPQQQTFQSNYSPPQHHNGQRPQYSGPPPYSNHEDNSHSHHPYDHPQRLNNQVSRHAPSYPGFKQPQFHEDIRRPPQMQGPVQSAGKATYVNRSRDHHDAHHNGRMAGNAVALKQRPNKKRKYNNYHDSRSPIRQPINRFNLDARPPQGPRRKQCNSARKHSAPQKRVERDGMERWSTSRDHLQSPWGTSSVGTSSSTLLSERSEYFQSKSPGAHGNQGYYRQQSTSNLETNAQSHYPSIEPEIEQQSSQDRTSNGDAKSDVADVDSNDTVSLETPLLMADPTLPNPQHYDYSSDSAMVTDDTPHEAEILVDTLPTPTVGDQGHDHQDWEYDYVMEDRATEVLSASQSAPPANTSTLDSNHLIFDVADDSMADVTANPWTTSP